MNNSTLLNKTREKISEIIASAILDGQNQIYDLKSGNATSEEVNKRMQEAHDFHLNKLLELLY